MAFAGEGCNARVGASVAVSELAAFGCWVALLSQVERRATHAPCRIYSVLRKCSVPHTTNGWKLHLLAHLTDTVWVFSGQSHFACAIAKPATATTQGANEKNAQRRKTQRQQFSHAHNDKQSNAPPPTQVDNNILICLS